MMTDLLTWSPINLGRWFGTPVRVHSFLIAFIVLRLLGAALTGGLLPIATTSAWILLLLLALILHELGHALMASWLGCDRDEVRLWPLGNLVGPAQAARSADNALVALAGPATSGALVLITALGLNLAGAQFVWNPFGNADPNLPNAAGAPRLAHGSLAAPLTPLWWIGWFGYLNWVLMIANLIPALPFDVGRVLRSYPANAAVLPSKDGIIALWTAHAVAALLVLVGLVRLLVFNPTGGITVIVLALLIEWMVQAEARMMEDGSLFEEGLFGYDFSQGYASLEGSTAKVRPYRESALRRWRRRRSELRRQRRQAREAAEGRRMDEILEKLHRAGRSALTDEEQQFLVRVSAKIRNRPKARG